MYQVAFIKVRNRFHIVIFLSTTHSCDFYCFRQQFCSITMGIACVIVVPGSDVVMVVSRVSIIDCLDHHGFTTPILLLDCSKHDLIGLAGLLYESLGARGVVFLVMQLLNLGWLLEFPGPSTIVVGPALLEMSSPLQVFRHIRVWFSWRRVSRF